MGMTDDAMKALAEAATEAAFEQDMAHNPSEKAYHEGRVDAYRNAFNILSAAPSTPAGLDVERAARDVDGLWEAEDGEPIRFLPEFAEALEDLRAALAASKP